MSVDRATTEPTDRSMPPVRITNVMPIATTSRNELSMKTLRITWPVANPGYRTAPSVNIETSRARVDRIGHVLRTGS